MTPYNSGSGKVDRVKYVSNADRKVIRRLVDTWESVHGREDPEVARLVAKFGVAP